jgi:hypothetical protein
MSWQDFVDFFDGRAPLLEHVTPDLAEEYARHVRTQDLAVDTHNRKIRRIVHFSTPCQNIVPATTRSPAGR